jgi:hypothetical protein
MSWEVWRRSRGGGGNLAEMVDKLEKAVDIVEVMSKCVEVVKVMGNLAEEVAHLAVVEVKEVGGELATRRRAGQNLFPRLCEGPHKYLAM